MVLASQPVLLALRVNKTPPQDKLFGAIKI
jgi:hypothetical protein